jgi:hypothetical protein
MTLLPVEFADLETFASTWCLATESERYSTRLATSVREMTDFYDAVTPRADAALNYLDQFPLDKLADEATNLLHLLYSMVMVSFPVEAWGQPKVPDTGSASFDCFVEPRP